MGTLKVLRSASLVEWLVFAGATLADAIVIWLVASGRTLDAPQAATAVSAVALVVMSWLAAAAEITTERMRSYRVVHAARIGLVLAVIGTVPLDTTLALLLICSLVSGICIYDTHPWNLALGLFVVFASAMLRITLLTATFGREPFDAVVSQISLLGAGSMIAGLGSQYIRRREELVEALKDVRRLDGTVMSLTRANLQYQDFAGEAEVVAMENERKRITRDIHDEVGYALTNNIMMMEAATDMMQRNPFGVPALISAARENAQEGLARIRESLYALRGQSVPHPTGLNAIARMVRIYERATGVRVLTGFGTASWQYDEAVDSAIYHLAQEALMNAFRHGKADKVTLIVSERPGEIVVTVRDNGLGADGHAEGIGLRGMRERLERVGGALLVDTGQGGFMVRGTIPLGPGQPRQRGAAKTTDGQDSGPREDPSSDC